MEANLLGYVLGSLDADETRRVEQYLERNQEAEKELRCLRRALVPLEWAREEFAPPTGLVERTLSRVAGQRYGALPKLPEPVLRSGPSIRSWWHRADVLVAASLLFCVTLLVPPGISYLRYRQGLAACANNLRVIYDGLEAYAQGHDGRFPNVADPYSGGEPVPAAKVSNRAAAGMFVPMLVDNGMLDLAHVSVTCPGSGPARQPASLNLNQFRDMSDCSFEGFASGLAPCYAYTLGYKEGGFIYGAGTGDDCYPVLSDRPPRTPLDLNSPNHQGRGQNVLFSGGHVLFLHGRSFEGDDLYTARDGQVHAGVCRNDFVLGFSGSRP